MPFHVFKFHDIQTISQSTQKYLISINSFNNDSNICPTQKIFYTRENDTHKKNFHTHENKAYTYQQNFHTHQILMISYP